MSPRGCSSVQISFAIRVLWLARKFTLSWHPACLGWLASSLLLFHAPTFGDSLNSLPEQCRIERDFEFLERLPDS